MVRSNEPPIYGEDLFGDSINPTKSLLRQRFIEPPFSVLDARGGDWQARKNAWIKTGIRSELGRDQMQSSTASVFKIKQRMTEEEAAVAEIPPWCGSSVFDPVLCECAYRWWSPEGGQILDPFAGGSVRGIVAGALGRNYWGCDLRKEQIDANIANAVEVPTNPSPVWVCGDSREMLHAAPESDFIFSCPPYGDLEVYSNDPRDISSYEFGAFVKAYTEIIALSCEKLRNNRFACFVVGDFRDKKTGISRNLPAGTIKCFQKAGLKLYNDVVLITVSGTAAIRATKQFEAGRKVVKTHQNMIVMVKGCWREATGYLNSTLKESSL